MNAMASQITGVAIVYPTVCSGAENIKAPRHWPLWGEFTGDRWIPHTKGQLRGKCFHLMTSSYFQGFLLGIPSWGIPDHAIYMIVTALIILSIVRRRGEKRGDDVKVSLSVQYGILLCSYDSFAWFMWIIHPYSSELLHWYWISWPVK